MKKLLLFGLMSITLSLGVSCKKDSEIVKEEVKVEKPVTKADATAIDNIFEYNENVYPHSTGLCYCGKGPKCHPFQHYPNCKAGQSVPGLPDQWYTCTCLPR